MYFNLVLLEMPSGSDFLPEEHVQCFLQNYYLITSFDLKGGLTLCPCGYLNKGLAKTVEVLGSGRLIITDFQKTLELLYLNAL